MISILRRAIPIISSSSSSSSSSLFPILSLPMDTSSPPLRLSAVAHHLRLYKPPPTPFDDSEDDAATSRVGVAESAAPPEIAAARRRRAAVLVCVFEGDAGELRVVLTKRSSTLSTHSGEVSLPGGKAEEGDEDDIHTATREAQEEIGLDPKLVNVVTVLEPFLSKHFLRVFPVIGLLENKESFKPTPNPGEVEAVFDVPLEMFIKDENRRVEVREWAGSKYFIHFFDYETENSKFLIWGLTAGILIRAASVIFQRQPPFLEQNPNFKIPSSLGKDTTLP